jgi:hypothetical protein
MQVVQHNTSYILDFFSKNYMAYIYEGLYLGTQGVLDFL